MTDPIMVSVAGALATKAADVAAEGGQKRNGRTYTPRP